MEVVNVHTWQCDTEGTAHAFLAGCPYLASVGLDELSGEVESKSRARLRPSMGIVGPEKLGKKFRLAALGDADSGVGDIDLYKIRDFFTANRYFGPRYRVFTSIT